MPIDKNKLVRLQVLDRCFSDRSRYYFIEDLRSKCREALEREGVPCPDVARRTIYKDIAEIEGNDKWNVLFEEPGKIGHKRYYRYADPKFSIWRNDLNELQLNQLKSMLLMLRQFQGLPQYDKMEDIIEELQQKYGFTLADTENVISFDTNLYVEGLDYLSPIFAAIINKRCLSITYQPFGKEQHVWLVHPYYIKQYNGRWFLLGLTENKGVRKITNFALDRIKSTELSTQTYIPTDIDFEEDYFADLMGVTQMDGEAIPILLAFSKNRFPYVVSKPLHPSQRMVDKEKFQISIKVKPTKEFYQQILSFGPDVEVLSPVSVREEVSQRIKNMLSSYSVQKDCTLNP